MADDSDVIAWDRYRDDPNLTPCPNCGAVWSRDDWCCWSCAFWPERPSLAVV